MNQFTCDVRLNFLDASQKTKLSKKFRNPNSKVMPHELVVSLRVKLPQAYAVVIALGSSGLCSNRLLIYHNCSEASVGSIPFGIGFPTLPWICRECGESIEDYNEMSFDVIAVAKEPIEFV
jgi:hypothetical protein